jgi:hypothetical protein
MPEMLFVLAVLGFSNWAGRLGFSFGKWSEGLTSFGPMQILAEATIPPARLLQPAQLHDCLKALTWTMTLRIQTLTWTPTPIPGAVGS